LSAPFGPCRSSSLLDVLSGRRSFLADEELRSLAGNFRCLIEPVTLTQRFDF